MPLQFLRLVSRKMQYQVALMRHGCGLIKPGTYFGQCSEICGKDHSYMPIEIKAVDKKKEFQKMVDRGKRQICT